MGKLNNDWYHGFRACFETDEDIIEFISERIDTKDFEDSYIDAGGYGEPNEMFKVTANDKKNQLIDYLDYTVERKDRLEKALKEYENTSITIKELTNQIKSCRLVAKYRNDDETGDYVKGYKDGYDKAIENVLKSVTHNKF